MIDSNNNLESTSNNNAIPEKDSEDNYALLSVLADPTRRAIFNLLLEKPKAVKVIAADMPISQAAVSQHLKIMRSANLVLDKKQGRYHLYSANPKALDKLAWQFSALMNDALSAQELNLPDASLSSPDFDLVDRAMEQWEQVWPGFDSLGLGVILRLRLIANNLHALSERASERFGLSSMYMQLLGCLDRISPQVPTLEELSKITFLSISATDKQIGYMEERGFIKREATGDDHRKDRVHITEQGRSTARQVLESLREYEHAPVFELPRIELDKLSKTLKPILGKLQEISSKPRPE